MNKKTFLTKLRSKLEILEKEEIDDIINEYSDHIDNKIEQGMKEKDAVSDFGDIDTLSDEILSAYKIKVKKSDSETKFEKFISEFIENVVILFTRAFDSISNQKMSKTITTVLYIIISLIAVSILMWFIRIPFEIAYNLIDSFVGLGPDGMVTNIIKNISRIFLEVLYLIIAIMIIFSLVKKGIAYFDESDIIEPKVEKASKKVTEETKKVVEKITPRDEKVFMDIILLLVKIFVIFTFYIPLLFTDFGLIIGLGMVIFLFTQGLYSFGLLLTIVGSLIISLALTTLLTKFLFYKGGEE